MRKPFKQNNELTTRPEVLDRIAAYLFSGSEPTEGLLMVIEYAGTRKEYSLEAGYNFACRIEDKITAIVVPAKNIAFTA
tara:strand:- start:464 stop:700 length:237 start_codon:yes stop_codon:yes gene_type:complete